MSKLTKHDKFLIKKAMKHIEDNWIVLQGSNTASSLDVLCWLEDLLTIKDRRKFLREIIEHDQYRLLDDVLINNF